jgi:anthraniloyl-CoA monooxygenase
VLLIADGVATEPGSGLAVPLRSAPSAAGRWGASLAAPEDESELPAALERLAALVAAGPVLVAVHGGTALTRTLLCEQVRLRHGVPALLVDDELDPDRAVTSVLSGRADLVGLSARALAGWAVPA